MHRHGYKGAKFGRERDQRRALLKSLADSLVLHESIETTLPKAKAVVSYTEKLVTKAKKGDLANRRRVISGLSTLKAAHKLVDELSPRLSSRNSGYFKIARITARHGDNAQMAKVSFVDDLTKKVTGSKTRELSQKTQDHKSQTAKDNETLSPEIEDIKSTSKVTKTISDIKQKISTKTSATQTVKRTGRRGNR